MIVKRRPPVIDAQGYGFCAICVAALAPGKYHQEMMDGKQVRICCACHTEHPRSGRYAFGGGAKDGGNVTNSTAVGQGNRQLGANRGR